MISMIHGRGEIDYDTQKSIIFGSENGVESLE